MLVFSLLPTRQRLYFNYIGWWDLNSIFHTENMFKRLTKGCIISHRKIHQDFIFITLIFVPIKNNITTFNMSRNFIRAMRLLPFS